MIRVFYIALAVVAGLLPLRAQTGGVDSLRQRVAAAEGEEKSAAYGDLYRELSLQGDIDQMLSLLEAWTTHERRRGDEVREGRVRWNKIAVLSNYCLDDALLAEAPVQMAWFERNGQWENYYNTWECKAGVYLYSGRVQTALHEAQLMLEDAQQRGNDFGRVVSYQLTGMIYENMSQCEPAIENLQRALELVKRMATKSDIIFSVYDYLCQALDNNRDFERELLLTDEWKDKIEEFRRRNGNIASFQGTDLSRQVQRCSALLGLERYHEADSVMGDVQAMLSLVNNPVSTYKVLLCSARLALALEQPAKTLAALDSLQKLDIDAGGSADFLRADALMLMGSYQEAANLYRQQYLSLDTIYNQDLRGQLSELSTLHKLDEQEMKARLQQSKYLFAFMAVVGLALVAFIVYRHLSAKRLAQKNRELEEANSQLLLANKRVEDASKMKADFIKSISHEIRTPLNILSGFTQVITSAEEDLPPAQLADIHRRINENTERIVQLVNKLLELSEAHSQTVIERADLVTAGDIVGDAICRVRMTSTADVVFSWDATDPAAATLLKTHRKNAVRALGCLLDNARKFTKKGMVAVRLLQRSRPSDGRLQRKTFLNFVVEDTGIGVSPDQADHIFEEFVQIDNYADGAGIGLTVARSIVRRLGGDIKLDTSYTAGSRFVMSLPLDA